MVQSKWVTFIICGQLSSKDYKITFSYFNKLTDFINHFYCASFLSITKEIDRLDRSGVKG